MSDPQKLPMSLTCPPMLSPDGSPVPIRWVEDLFERLTAIVGSAMATVYAGADEQRVKAEWAGALAGFSVDEVKRGLAATRTRKFAPNLPEFLHLCRPALDPERAWIEVERGMRAKGLRQPFAWSHPAVYWAARAIDYGQQDQAFDKVRKRWVVLLEAEFAKGAWATPPDFSRQAIAAPVQREEPRPPPTPERKAQIAAMLRATRERLSGFATRQAQDAVAEDAEARL